MNKTLYIFLLLISLSYACSSATKEEQADSTEVKEVKEVKKKKRVLHMVETSELAQLMRKMDNELHAVKTCIEGGYSFHDSITFDYGKIYTAHATEIEMKKEGFDDFATAYLTQLENLKNSTGEKRKENYNLLVNGCLNCHSQHCPGPMNKIKTLLIK